MEFLSWHYTRGLDNFFNKWIFSVKWIIHYFSLHLLLRTLFSPYKRMIEVDRSPGFDFQRYFENLTFNLISRGIGAIVRLALFFSGLIMFVVMFYAGAIGMLFFIIFPPLGYPHYIRFKKRPDEYLKNLIYSAKKNKENAIATILASEAGSFWLKRLGVQDRILLEKAQFDDKFLDKLKAESFEELVAKMLELGVWKEEFLRSIKLSKEDLLLAAKWWDLYTTDISGIRNENYYGRPGMGLDLIYGYTPTLNQYSIDLAAPQSFSHRLIGRENIVSQMERALTAGNSVVLIGDPGVGKKTVVLEFAKRAVEGKLGADMAYRRILEFDYNSLLSGSSDANTKKANLAQILAEAANAGNVTLMVRDIQRLTNSEVEGYDFTDTFEEYMEGRQLKIIAVSTPREYERFISPNMRLRKYLKEVEVYPPDKEQALEILVESAMYWEKHKNMVITVPAIRKILIESDKYITEVPFPEKALELLESVVFAEELKKENLVTVEDAIAVLAEKTGVSFAHLTGSERKQLTNIEKIIHKNLVNQDSAVELMAKSLRGRSVGVKKEDKPIGSFLFLGPTGVGKTETAKVLADVYFGSSKEILRFDMAEYAGREGLERLIGSVEKNQPGSLTTAIKNKPASLLLLDEIEKATREIYNLFLSLLDEGTITDAFGRKVNCKNLFVIATSNAGAEFIRQQVQAGVFGEDLQKGIVDYVLKNNLFTPEFVNRFDGVIVYEPLKEEHLVEIARLLLNKVSKNLESQNIYFSAAEEAIRKLAKDGYNPAFGARPMNRIIDLSIGDLLGRAILEEDVKPGDRIELLPGEGKEEFKWRKV
jgi:ATP-dependent Clp protease ATP-binding subunit ClpA